jgi:hypothetical protein
MDPTGHRWVSDGDDYNEGYVVRALSFNEVIPPGYLFEKDREIITTTLNGQFYQVIKSVAYPCEGVPVQIWYFVQGTGDLVLYVNDENVPLEDIIEVAVALDETGVTGNMFFKEHSSARLNDSFTYTIYPDDPFVYVSSGGVNYAKYYTFTTTSGNSYENIHIIYIGDLSQEEIDELIDALTN